MNNFTPISAFLGGLFIGAAALLLLICNGRVLGVSGILANALRSRLNQSYWQFIFILGLLSGGVLCQILGLVSFNTKTFSSVPIVVAAGLLVGFGTRLGSGCTSGHGICGISRLSIRSMIATLVFMVSGILTVYIFRHILGVL